MAETEQLLADYARDGSESAFRELVNRYIDLVYSVALRQVNGDAHRAEDVAQIVFSDLAKLASTLQREVRLGGWLHRHTCFVAAKMMRRERRRELRERQAVEIYDANSASAGLPGGPALDQAIDQLRDEDRIAILLRFFEERDFRSIGQALGTSEDAARMRVNRALEKLETLLKRQGVTASAAVLAGGLSVSAVQAAPAGLATTLAAVSLANAAGAAGGLTVLKIAAMGKLKLSILGAVVLAGVATPFAIQHQRAAVLREENQRLRERLDQLAWLAGENERLSNQLAKASLSPPAPPDQQFQELLRLRGEVSRLRGESEELARLKSGNGSESSEAAVKLWLNRVALLKQRLADTPQAAIPELQLLQQEDWLAAVKDRKLETDGDYRRAMAELRRAAEAKLGSMLQSGLKQYRASNGGEMPRQITELQPYLDSIVAPPMLERWAVLPASTTPSLGMGGSSVITQKAPIDDVFDTRFAIGPDGFGTTDFLSGSIGKTMNPVWDAYRTAHQGQWPDDVAALTPYATTPEQRDALDKLILRNSTKK